MKITVESIREELAPLGWDILSTEYKNLDGELSFKCDEGHTVTSSWRKIRQKAECPVCKANTYKTQSIKVIPKPPTATRCLALDQSTRIIGYAIYDNKELVRYGIHTAEGDEEIRRDHSIKEWVLSMVENWKPDFVALEGIQYQQNMGVTTFETLARLQGILMETLFTINLPYKVCPTNTWRAHCGVKGRTRADKKRSMQLLAKKWFDVSVTDDEADAIGIGKYAADNPPFVRAPLLEWV